MAKSKKKPIIVITGSAGNIGTALSKALKKDYQVVGFDKKESKCDIPIDLTSEDSVKLAFKNFEEKYGKKIAAVIHLSAYFDFTGEDSPLYEKVNVKGTKILLKILQDFDVERFVFSSTMLVQKAGKPSERINEKTPVKPKWVYPKSKAKTEKVIQKSHGKIPYLILRIAGLYNNSTCVPTLAHQIARIYERDMKSHLHAGDIQAGQSFIHQDDLIRLFEQAIKYRKKLPKEEIILAGEEEAVSYAKLQQLIGGLIHGEKKWKTWTLPSSLAKAGAFVEEKTKKLIPEEEGPFIRPFMIDLAFDHYALDISKARKKLKWKPKHHIKKDLPKIIRSLKKNPKRWYEENEVPLPDWMETTKKAKAPEKIRVKYEEKFRHEHQQNLWAHFLNVAMGFWLITSPFTLGYQSYPLVISDIVSGFFVVIFGFLSLSWRLAAARWICAAIGFWLLFAPLVFWAPTAAAYLNDTLVGSLVIGFAVLTRPSVGVAPNAVITGPTIPAGWEFTPSSWFQRLPIIILAFVGLFISRYLTAYQLEHIKGVWEPFFMGSPLNTKNGTEEIITSYVSKAWPVPDAGVGAVTYILEVLTGIIGSSRRWRTMPWLVLFFGFMIIPLGVVSITFIIIQPILLNTWCTLCLIAAAAMVLQIPYSFDEIVATLVFLWRRWKAGRPLLKILFVGDTEKVEKNEKHTEDSFEQSPWKITKEMWTGGIGVPWTLIASVFIGVWLMLTRLILGTTGPMANADHLIGSLVITVSITAWAEVMRIIRFINIFFAIALWITPFIYSANSLTTIISIIVGLVLFALSIPRGKIKNHYGEWDIFIK